MTGPHLGPVRPLGLIQFLTGQLLSTVVPARIWSPSPFQETFVWTNGYRVKYNWFQREKNIRYNEHRESGHESEHSGICLQSSHLWHFSGEEKKNVSGTCRKNKVVCGRCYQLRFSAKFSQEHKRYIFTCVAGFHICGVFFLCLSPFSYGYNFSQGENGVTCPAVEQMTNKGCSRVPWHPKLFSWHASGYPEKCHAVAGAAVGPPSPAAAFWVFQEPLEIYPGESQMAGSGPSCHFQSLLGELRECVWLSRVLWAVGLSTVGSNLIYLYHSHSYCNTNLEELLKRKWQMVTIYNCHWLNNQCGFLLSERLMFFTVYALSHVLLEVCSDWFRILKRRRSPSLSFLCPTGCLGRWATHVQEAPP